MRRSGILMPVSSLPGAYGIGSLGEAAYQFVDFLKNTGQYYWQILPIGPTGYGDSPYQSFSAFSGNPYWIDLDVLCKEGLLKSEECAESLRPEDETVDYAWLFATRCELLHFAAERLNIKEEKFNQFCSENAFWLEDYALFMALKVENKYVSWQEWADNIRLREACTMEDARLRLKKEVFFWKAVQFLFHKQWYALKDYANQKGVCIIGDIPIYVSPDSSELWADSELFQTDSNRRLTHVSGVPPDGFSASGQLWGNPLYNWSYHKQTNYSWWISRLKHANKVYDITRIDHFRGFASFFSIPASDTSAVNGHWEQGPGKDFIESIQGQLPNMQIIAEDLGYLTEEVKELLHYSGFPGMKILQFAFDSREASDYLPHNYERNCVVYTGTHDNTTTADWRFSAPPEDVSYALRYLGCSPANFTEYMIRVAMACVADTAIIPMADWLELGAEARINTPSTLGGNWVWRVSGDVFSPKLVKHIREVTDLFGRVL